MEIDEMTIGLDIPFELQFIIGNKDISGKSQNELNYRKIMQFCTSMGIDFAVAENVEKTHTRFRIENCTIENAYLIKNCVDRFKSK
jgi:hypothetical protein